MYKLKVDKNKIISSCDIFRVRIFLNATEVWMKDGNMYVIHKPINKILVEDDGEMANFLISISE